MPFLRGTILIIALCLTACGRFENSQRVTQPKVNEKGEILGRVIDRVLAPTYTSQEVTKDVNLQTFDA